MSATRDTPFGYACHGCGHCCHHYLVRLNAYEVERLKVATGQPASSFTITRAGLQVLRQDEATGRCTFRSNAGCAVYTDRPLACRLYPLLRTIDAAGGEHWDIPPPDPGSHGAYDGPGTIGDYVAGLDTALFMRATDGQ